MRHGQGKFYYQDGGMYEGIYCSYKKATGNTIRWMDLGSYTTSRGRLPMRATGLMISSKDMVRLYIIFCRQAV